MLFLEYNEAEKMELEQIDKKYDIKTITEKLKNSTAQERAEYGKILVEHSSERAKVNAKRRERTLEFYSSNLDELEKKIKETVQEIILASSIEKDKLSFDFSFRLQEYGLKETILAEISLFLNLLKEKRPKKYHDLLKYIDKSIEYQESIITAENDKKLPLAEKSYTMLPQDTGLNKFNKIAQMNDSRGILEIFGGALTYTQKEITIKIPHYEELWRQSSLKGTELNTPMKKMLDLSTAISRELHSPRVEIPLKDFMKITGVKDEKEARKQVNHSLDVLADIMLSFDDSKNKNRSSSYRDLRVIGEKGIKKGKIFLVFSLGFFEEIEKMPLMPYPLRILQASKGNQKNRNSYYLAHKICELQNMNTGARNERIISVKTLLAACPYLATENEVRQSDRRLYDRIINPFIADLEEALRILGIGEDGYEWFFENGISIPDSELSSMEYETFIKSYIHLDKIPDYPAVAVSENKEKRRAEAAKVKEKENRKKPVRKKSKSDKEN